MFTEVNVTERIFVGQNQDMLSRDLWWQCFVGLTNIVPFEYLCQHGTLCHLNRSPSDQKWIKSGIILGGRNVASCCCRIVNKVVGRRVDTGRESIRGNSRSAVTGCTVAGFLNAPPRSHGIRWGNQINVIIHFVQIYLRIICTKFHENLLKIDGDTAQLYPNWQYWQTAWHFLHILWHSIHWTYLWYLFIRSPQWFHTLAHPKNLLFSSSIRMGHPTAKLLSGSIVITPPSAELLSTWRKVAHLIMWHLDGAGNPFWMSEFSV